MKRSDERDLRAAFHLASRARLSLGEGATAEERRAGDIAGVALRSLEAALGVKLCQECGREFHAVSRRSDALYCSHRCACRHSLRESQARKDREGR